MIELKQVDNASRMIQLLSSLFRFSTGQINTDGLVTLKSELEHVNYYVGIEQLRHQNSFEFTIDLEDEIAHSLDHIQVIKLILQPLIENAIKYGVSKIHDGEILLAIYQENNTTTDERDLICYIYNSGPSVDPDEIHKILNQPEDDSIDEKSTRGFALRNVNSRIKLKYGKMYGVTCYAPPNGGSVFIIKQPLVIKEKNECIPY